MTTKSIWIACGKCRGVGRINNGWFLPNFVDCVDCVGRGGRYLQMPEQDSSERSTPIKKADGMFDTLEELCTSIDDSVGENWKEGELEFVTPDGKRWRIQRYAVVVQAVNNSDRLECYLREVQPVPGICPPRATVAVPAAEATSK